MTDRPQGGNELPAFWAARETHQHVYNFARARRTSPWAVFGAVLARVVVLTPPYVRLPAAIGGEGSLNLFVAIVGASGAGKGAASRVADAAWHWPHIEHASPGSGEGLAALFRTRKAGNVVPTGVDAVLLDVPEVSTLTALNTRTGATLPAELNKAWTGEALGFQYMAIDKRLPVPAHTYRLAMVVGVQPNRAGVLLDDADAGTPQRYVWLPALDPDMPDERPPEPHWHHFVPVEWTDEREMKVCDVATAQIDEMAVRRNRGEVDALDAHALLCRLKVAAALALLDGHNDVNDEDWDLAGAVMRQSDRTRAAVIASRRRVAAEHNRQRGFAEGERAAIVHESKEARAIARVSQLIEQYLSDGASLTESMLSQRLASRDREHVDVVLAHLLGRGRIEIDHSHRSPVYRRAGGTP